MTKNLEEMPIESLVSDIVNEVIDVNRLNLAKANQRKAFLQAIDQRPALLRKVSKINEDHFLPIAIKKKPNYFVHLSKKQYSNQLAQIYLFSRLAESKTGEKSQPFSVLVRKSLDDKILLTYSYTTVDGDELNYLDKELEVPTSLKSNVVVTLKVNQAVNFIEKLDIHVTQLGEEKIKGIIHDVIAKQYKKYLNAYILEKQIGYYTLSTSLDVVEEGFIKVLGEAFKPYGIGVSEFTIRNIAIPKDIQHKIEDQAFKIRQRREDIAADAEFARVSLESYEAKLAVHSRYPNNEVTLTEYEKDLALKRYLTKIGRKQDNVDHSIKIRNEKAKADTTVAKPEDIVPEIKAKPNTFRTAYIACAVLAFIVSLVIFSINTSLALIFSGIFILIFGLVAAFNTSKFVTEKIEPTIVEDRDEVTSPDEGSGEES